MPDLAQMCAELDSFDIVERLKIKHGPLVEVLNAVSLHGGLVGSWAMEASLSASAIVEALAQHWRQWGLPAYAQFDNDTVFQGAHQHRDVISRLMRLCLSLGVVPVFVPVAEQGFQAAADYPEARLVYIRRSDGRGVVSLLGHSFLVEPLWRGRLLRCEVMLGEGVIGFHQLRRRMPTEQPLLREQTYWLPRRRFRE